GNRAAANLALIIRELVVRAPGRHGREGSVCGSDARQYRVVAALDPRKVDHAGSAAEQRPAREHEIGHRLPTTFGDGARAIADPLSTFEDTADRRMRLEALEFVVGRQIRLGVVQMDDEANGDEVFA